jgi:glycosyltransferase involved in cell wall biosynthesis
MTDLAIAHVLSSFGMGGQERVALDLAARQRATGHRVLAVSLAAPPEGPMSALFRAAGVDTWSIAKRGAGFDPTLAMRVAKYLSFARVDVVHTHNPQALVYGAPAAALARCPCVHTKHGVNPDPPRRMWLRRAAAKMVDAYVAVTPTLARLAIERNECDATQLHVIPNGIDTTRFAPNIAARQRARAELGIAESAWVVGTVGRLSPEKNQGLLIDAMAPMLDPRRHLIIVGDGPERAQLQARAQATLRPELVHFTGARNDPEAWLAAFDAFALTSDSEGLPLVVLEAMAVGLPVVATAVGGIPDVVEHDITGTLVPPGDRHALTTVLVRLATRPQSAREMASRARRMVLERHSTEHMVEGYERLYARVRRRGRAPVREALVVEAGGAP